MAKRSRWSGAKLLMVGLALLVLGTAPLLTVIFLSSLGIGDTDPNPVGLGLLAFFTFWPAVGMSVAGLVRVVGERVRDRGET